MAHIQLTVAPSNEEQARAWDGDEGRYWADHADEFDAALRRYTPRFLDAARLSPSDRVLDVGCGTGGTAVEAARRVPQGSVLGVDLSSAMVDVARRHAAHAGLGNVTFEQADAQIHPFDPEAFVVVLARTSAMFFGDRPAAFAHLARALRPGGRLVLLTWQPVVRNEWIQRILGAFAAGRELPVPPPEAPGPFSLSEPAVVRSLLGRTGYVDVTLDDLRRPMYFGPTAAQATAFVHGLNEWMLHDLDEGARREAVDALAGVMAEAEGPDGVELGSATWLVTATRQ
jgi:SAM-dependent methyltransferase